MRIVCLSNSFKEGGRCLAGIRIDKNLTIQGTNGRAQWIRPVCDTEHEQVPNAIASDFKYYDILEFTPDPSYKREDYQSENVLIKDNEIQFVQNVSITKIIDSLCDKPPVFQNIFGNTGKSVSNSYIDKLNHSLMMVKATTFQVTRKNTGYSSHLQTRIIFKYNGQTYNLPVTDPYFLHKYELDQEILDSSTEIYLALSLGVEFNSYYYKLVATVLY